MKNIRKYSVEILIDVLEKEKLLKVVLEDLSNYDIDEIDKKFINKEVVGTIENLDLIDYVINLYSKIKIAKLDFVVKAILRVGVYELLFMDKVPSYATINELVNLSKQKKMYKYSSFINAVLRNVDRNIKYENVIKDVTIPIYIRYSIPKDIYDIYIKENVDISNLNIKNLKRIYLRFNVFNDERINDILNEFDQKKIIYKKYFGELDFKYFKVYEIFDVKEVIKTNAFNNGYISIEDASSIYFIEKIYDYINESSNYKILDACSSPGGKIIGLMTLLKTKNIMCEATIRDISKEKIEKINENIKLVNVSNYGLQIKNACEFDINDVNKYNIIMCDVPCSGLGVIFKKPDIKYNFKKRNINELIEIQKRILNTQSKYLMNEGLISYSTCTINSDENEKVIDEFLKNNNNFIKIQEKKILINDANNCDGFYFSILKRIA